jgi:hypothetical protein
MTQTPNGFKNLFKPDLGAVSVLRAEQTRLTGQETNFTESMLTHHIMGIGNAMLQDGQILEGCKVLMGTGTAALQPGQLYLAGRVINIASAEFAFSQVGEFQIGIWTEAEMITAEKDPQTLIFDMPTHPGHGDKLNPYRRQLHYWGLSTDAKENTAETSFSFFPIYFVKDGALVDVTPPPQNSGFNALLAAYDRSSNGHYVVDGMAVSLLQTNGDDYEIGVTEGTAHVNGFRVERANSQRLEYVNAPEVQSVNGEPHAFTAPSGGTMTIELNRSPIASIEQVTILKEFTMAVQHGPYSGATDSLNIPSLYQVTSVTQGGTTYQAGVDFNLSGDSFDWSLAGDEPAPGSTYQVIGTYFEEIVPDAVTETSITVTGAINGSAVSVDYEWKLPRIDVITLTQDNKFHRLVGAAHPSTPRPPSVPTSHLALAEIHLDWADDPIVENVAVQVVSMRDRQTTRDLAILGLRESAALRLQMEANMRSPQAKSAIFVDNFDDTEMRDRGRAQNLLIADGFLALPMSVAVHDDLAGTGHAWTNPFALSTIVEQTLETGDTKINPYAATERILAAVKLTPSVDQWEIVQEVWNDPVRIRLSNLRRRIRIPRNSSRSTGRTTRTRTSSSVETTVTTQQAAFLRQRSVTYELKGFEPNETLTNLTFDNIEIPLSDPAPVANAAGELTGSFAIPPNVPTGSKSVEFFGDQGSLASGSYVGSGTITIRNMRRVITTRRVITSRRRSDPAGFYFSHFADYRLAKVEIKLKKLGDASRPIVMQLRELASSQPIGAPLAEVELDLSGRSVGDILEFNLPVPVHLLANEQYGIIFLTDDNDHAAAIAKLGKVDTNTGQTVGNQPNINMVAVLSSNNDHFEVHHDWDFYTKIYEAVPTTQEFTVELGTLDVAGITDIMVLAGAEEPAGTLVELIVQRADGTQILTHPGSPVAFETPVTETLTFKAVLTASDSLAPVLFDNIQIVTGTIGNSGNYTSNAFACGDNRTVEIVTAEFTPGASSYEIQLRDNAGNYVTVPKTAEEHIGDGWMQRTYRIEAFTTDTTAINIIANGTAKDRPAMHWYTATPLEV